MDRSCLVLLWTFCVRSGEEGNSDRGMGRLRIDRRLYGGQFDSLLGHPQSSDISPVVDHRPRTRDRGVTLAGDLRRKKLRIWVCNHTFHRRKVFLEVCAWHGKAPTNSILFAGVRHRYLRVRSWGTLLDGHSHEAAHSCGEPRVGFLVLTVRPVVAKSGRRHSREIYE